MTAERPMNRPLRHVLVVAKKDAPAGVDLASRLGAWFRNKGVRVSYARRTSIALGLGKGVTRDNFPRRIDMILVAGGDGTLLSTARMAGPRRVPILGINLGSLGFLTELQPEQDLFEALEPVVRGHYTIEERRSLRVRLFHGSRKRREDVALNDAVIAKSALARMIELEVAIDRERVTSYLSDGLIVASPTGSTAYSLSAGGPIVDPSVPAFVLTPICPHSMTYRPLIVPGTVHLEVVLKSARREDVLVTLDGQVGYPLSAEDRVVIDEHPKPVRLVRVAGRSFFDVLRRKLRWGSRP